MTLRRTIIDALIVELKKIKIVNGFSYDQEDKDVYDWLTVKLDPNVSTTAIEVRDLGDDIDNEESYAVHVLNVEIALYVTSGQVQDDTRDRMQDVITAVKNLEANAVIDYIDFTGTEIEFDRERKLIGAALLRFDVRYNSGLFEL